MPEGIGFRDEVQLPSAMPLFELFLTQYSGHYVVELLDMDELFDIISGGETFWIYFVLMFPCAANDIVRDTHVNGSARFGSKDVDVVGEVVGGHRR